MRHLMAAVVTVAFTATSLAPVAVAATQPKDDKALLLKKKKTADAAKKKKLLDAEKRADALKKIKGQKASLQKKERDKRLVARKDCKGFMQCLFGSRKVRVTTNGRPVQYASLASAGLSGRKSRQTVDWNESQVSRWLTCRENARTGALSHHRQWRSHSLFRRRRQGRLPVERYLHDWPQGRMAIMDATTAHDRT